MENNNVKNAIDAMLKDANGDITLVGERLFKQGIIPADLIVTTDYTVFANNVNEVFGFDTEKDSSGVRQYFKSSFEGVEYIKMLGFKKISKNDTISKISKGTFYYDETATGFVKTGREFSRTSPTNNNPIYSDGTKTIQISNNGTVEMNLVTAVYIAVKYSNKPVAKALSISLMDKASQKYQVEQEKKIITNVAKDAIESATNIIADTAKTGYLSVKNIADVEKFIESSVLFNAFSGLKFSDEYYTKKLSIIDEQSKVIKKEINKKEREISALYDEETEDSEYEIHKLNSEISDLRFSREKIRNYRDLLSDERAQSLKDKKSKIDNKAYTLTEILKEYRTINPNSKFTNATEVNDLLKTKEILIRNNQWRLNPNNQWRDRASILGLFPDGNTLVTIHWNSLGKSLIMRLLAYEDGYKVQKNGDKAGNNIIKLLSTEKNDELETLLQYDEYKIKINKKAV